jgi:hypothetical protein
MIEWYFGSMAQGFIKQYGVWSCAMMVELNQHHNSKVETLIEMYRTLLKQHNCSLNMCGLEKHDLD